MQGLCAPPALGSTAVCARGKGRSAANSRPMRRVRRNIGAAVERQRMERIGCSLLGRGALRRRSTASRGIEPRLRFRVALRGRDGIPFVGIDQALLHAHAALIEHGEIELESPRPSVGGLREPLRGLREVLRSCPSLRRRRRPDCASPCDCRAWRPTHTSAWLLRHRRARHGRAHRACRGDRRRSLRPVARHARAIWRLRLRSPACRAVEIFEAEEQFGAGIAAFAERRQTIEYRGGLAPGRRRVCGSAAGCLIALSAELRAPVGFGLYFLMVSLAACRRGCGEPGSLRECPASQTVERPVS